MSVVETLTVLGVAATPVLELRGAIPLAIVQFGWTPMPSLLVAALGNLAPIPFLVVGLDFIERIVRRTRFGHSIFLWWVERGRRHTARLHHPWGIDVALAILVAIPLPGTGAWTGVLIAWLLGMAVGRASLAIGLGVIGAGLIVTAGTLGLIQLF